MQWNFHVFNCDLCPSVSKYFFPPLYVYVRVCDRVYLQGLGVIPTLPVSVTLFFHTFLYKHLSFIPSFCPSSVQLRGGTVGLGWTSQGTVALGDVPRFLSQLIFINEATLLVTG